MGFTDEEMRKYSFRPAPVVESRVDKRKIPWSFSYSPEVSFDGAHYVIGPPKETREEAESIANAKSEEMIAAMIAAAMPFVAGLKKAKE